MARKAREMAVRRQRRAVFLIAMVITTTSWSWTWNFFGVKESRVSQKSKVNSQQGQSRIRNYDTDNGCIDSTPADHGEAALSDASEFVGSRLIFL